MNYNTMKDKWNVHELQSMLVQEETRLKNLESHYIQYVKNQGVVGKKVAKKHGNGKGPLRLMSPQPKSRIKMTNVISVGSLDISRRIA